MLSLHVGYEVMELKPDERIVISRPVGGYVTACTHTLPHVLCDTTNAHVGETHHISLTYATDSPMIRPPPDSVLPLLRNHV